MKSLIPDLPVFPDPPHINWTYENGNYCLSESDVDKLLNFFENKIPKYLSDLKIWENKHRIVLNYL